MTYKDKTYQAAAPFVALLLLALAVSPRTTADAGQGDPGEAKGKLAFLLTTGLEDIDEIDMCLQYAVAAKKTRQLTDVAILLDGRGVEALAGHMGARPQQTRELADQAKTAGVRLIVSTAGLKQTGVPSADLDPKPDEIVPDGASRIAGLIGLSYEVIHF